MRMRAFTGLTDRMGLPYRKRPGLAGAFSSAAVLVALAALLPAPAAAQSAAIAVGSATGNAGTSVDITIGFTPGSTGVATLQFDLGFSSALTFVSTSTGSAAAAAEKSASSSTIPGGIRVLIFGLNRNVIGAGPIAVIRLTIATGTPPQVLPITISGITASDPDANPVSATGSNGSVTVTAPPDTTPPVISNVSASNVTATGATISWTTNEPANSQVEYGTTTAYGSFTTLGSSMVTAHSQSLTGLTPSTLYNYRVRSRDAAGNLAISGNYTFTTAAAPDTTPPVISNVSASNITATGATISWTTNEPANSQVEYGTTTAYGSFTTLGSSMVTSHSQNLTGLTPSTLYNYRVRSRDAAGNLAISGNYTFTTTAAPDTTPPIITAVTVTDVTESSATISWSTNEPSDSQVQYGTTTSYGNFTPLDSDMVTSHVQELTGLAAKTLYHFRVISKDAAGNAAVSQNFTFTTLGSGPDDVKKTFFVPRRRNKKTAQANGEGAEYTGLALVNTDRNPAKLFFTACDASGATIGGDGIVNPVTRQLDPGRQLPLIDTELFGPGISLRDGGWIKVESTVSSIAGFFMTFDSGLNVLDGTVLPAAPAASSILSEIEPAGFTHISVENPNAEAANLTLELVGSGGNLLAPPERKTVSANGSLEAYLFEDLFSGLSPSGSGYLRITSDKPVVALELTGKEGVYINALNGLGANTGATKLYCPQYAVGGPWRTAISVVNLDARAGMVTFKFFPQDPSQPAETKSVPISRYGKLYIDSPGFFDSLAAKPDDEIAQGYVVIESDGIRLVGSVTFGDAGRRAFSSTLPLQAKLENSLLFGHVAASDTFFTGLAIVNPHDTEIFVLIDLYGADGGAPLFSTTQNIAPKGRSSRLLAEYFPILLEQQRTSGYIRVTANMPVAGFAVFGTSDLSVLSAIPPQSVP